MTSCKICQKTVDELHKYTINDPICANCEVCKKCKVCIASTTCCKKNTNMCEYCCHKCTRCDKLMLKNNWPEDIIINNKCEKCDHICHNCNKYTQYSKLYYKDIDTKYCYDCFTNKFYPKDNLSKYSIVSKKKEHGNLFFRWNKTHEHINCDKCQKTYWKHTKFKQTICNKCKKNTNTITNNPSNNFKIYSEMTINNKQLWKLSKERKKCFLCYSSIWMDINNLKKGNQYYCNNCQKN